MSKLIGISGNLVELEYPKGKIQKRVIVGDVYVKAIEENIGIPIIIPILAKIDLKDLVSRLDGLVLTGGGDISPHFYGEENSNEITDVLIERDEFEIELVKEMVKQGKPVLGICRGMQIINIAFGGTIYKEINHLESTTNEHWQTKPGMKPAHLIHIEKNSILYDIFGKKVYVNSFHHQAIKKVANGFKVTAWSSDDVIEAIEKEGKSFILGVQWHPEEMTEIEYDMSKLFNEFIRNT